MTSCNQVRRSTPEIEITEVGTYSVTVTTSYGCTTSVTFNVIESEQATIEFTEQVDFADPNNITVTISGIGNYLRADILWLSKISPFRLTKKISIKRFKLYLPCGYKVDPWHTIVHCLTLVDFLGGF